MEKKLKYSFRLEELKDEFESPIFFGVSKYGDLTATILEKSKLEYRIQDIVWDYLEDEGYDPGHRDFDFEYEIEEFIAHVGIEIEDNVKK